PGRYLWQAEAPGGWRVVRAAGRGRAAEAAARRACRPAVLLVAPALTRPLAGGCVLIGKDRLAIGGPVAVRLGPGAARITVARPTARPWHRDGWSYR
ncbi:MAG: hypothetical protein AAF677_18605, partial [Pseudomonadota bacterium]